MNKIFFTSFIFGWPLILLGVILEELFNEGYRIVQLGLWMVLIPCAYGLFSLYRMVLGAIWS
jgi:hypothetical protein